MGHHEGSSTRSEPRVSARSASTVDLYWIPLGAGSPIVQASGRIFEAISALWHRRPRCDLYHAALQVSAPQGRYTIEQAPVPDGHGEERGVVAVGPVVLRVAGRLRIFRYEVRCWRDGIIPDLAFAVDSPVRLATDAAIASRIIEELPGIPTPAWGRDEAKAGEMWNSNSVVAWVLTRSGIDLDQLRPPPNGRAPGWNAGRAVASAPSAHAAVVTMNLPPNDVHPCRRLNIEQMMDGAGRPALRHSRLPSRR